MPFPFFRLPFELRYIIYQYLFTPEYGEDLIAPDVGHSHLTMRLNQSDGGEWPAVIRLNCQALPLMRTCKQAHDESTNILYGSNTFCFEDVLYNPQDTSWLSDSFDCSPHLCGIFPLYPFLSVIGRANRMKLRHLDLKFYTYTTYAIPCEASVWDSKDKADRSVASSVSNALDFLSQSHQLQSLVLNFEGSYWSLARFSVCFSKDSEIYRSLTQFKAIRKLKCCVDMYLLYKLNDAKYMVYEEAVENYHELRAELAAAYALESRHLAPSSTKNTLQSDPIA